MFFEDEKENLDNIGNLDDLDLDLSEDADDESISWDELLKDSSVDTGIVSISPNANDDKKEKNAKPKVKSIKETKVKEEPAEEPVIIEDELQDEIEDVNPSKTSKKDAFEVFGGNTSDENLTDVDDIMDEESQSILNELDNMEASEDLPDDDLGEIGIKQDTKRQNIYMILGIVFAAALVVGSIIFMFAGSKNAATPDIAQQNNPAVEQTSAEPSADTQEPPKEDMGASSEEEQIPVVDDKEAKNLKAEKKVVVSVESAGRLNPFMPTFDDFNNNYYAGIPAQVLMPPDKYGTDSDAQELMRVSVSGILFDNVKPSAIITINGIDYFVQKGDMVDDYLVMDINRQSVVVKKGTNIYKAGVGERFNQNIQISGAAVYGSGGTMQYKSVADEYTSASDVEVRAVED